MQFRLILPFAQLVLLLVLGQMPAESQQRSVEQAARAVDEHYNHLKTFKAEFIEIYQGDGISRTESGRTSPSVLRSSIRLLRMT